jgi:hypothetical protein
MGVTTRTRMVLGTTVARTMRIVVTAMATAISRTIVTAT